MAHIYIIQEREVLSLYTILLLCQGDVIWAAVSMGKHANPTRFPTKYYKNIAFNLQGDEGVWERGAKVRTVDA